jgi:Cd2+/Zn2+-exporting ATPase
MLKEKGKKPNIKNKLSGVKNGVRSDRIMELTRSAAKEQSDLNVIIRLAAGIVLLIIAGLSFMPPAVRAVLEIIAFLVCTYDMIIAAVRSVTKKRIFVPEVLVTLAGIIALCVGEFSDAVLFAVFYRVFDILIRRAVDWAAHKTASGLDLRTKEVRLYSDDRITVVPADSVRVGDIYMVAPGDVIPLDGVVHNGASELDTEPLTGETVTRKVQKDSVVLSGCINVSGTLLVEVTAELSDSVVSKRVGFTAGYDTFRAKADDSFKRIRSIFVPAVCGIALILGVIVPIFAGDFPKWLHTAAVLLAAASPVPYFAAAALTYYSQLGRAAGNGVLIRDKDTADRLTKVSHVVFDKDGTLSTGRFTIKETESKRLSENELLMLASYALINSETQIAAAIREQVQKEPDKKRVKTIMRRTASAP